MLRLTALLAPTRLAPALLAPALLAAPAAAQGWSVDREASSVGFETAAFGGSVTGEFADWAADIVLDPNDLSGARIEARVVTASGSAGSGEIDENLLSPAGLAPQQYETACFVSEDIRATKDGYEAHGALTIRGTEQDIVLPFSLKIDGNRAVADSRFEIARGDYGVGGPSWGSTAASVAIVLHIEAHAAE